MSTVSRPVTADDLLLVPDDGFRYELLRGELRRMSQATTNMEESLLTSQRRWIITQGRISWAEFMLPGLVQDRI